MDKVSLIIAIIIVSVVSISIPTWLLMLFLNNLGIPLGFWESLPAGAIITALIGSSNARN
jgi:hypothetical protein